MTCDHSQQLLFLDLTGIMMAFQHAGEINELIISIIRLVMPLFRQYVTICVIDCVDHIPYGIWESVIDEITRFVEKMYWNHFVFGVVFN